MTKLFEAKPFIVAEIGSNWRDFEDCINSISMAKSVGADAVKFQLFDWETLHGHDARTTLEKQTRYPMPYQLPAEWLPKLKEKADACDIEFMCTAFSPELVATVDPFVEVHKVASAEMAWPQLLDAIAKTGKPVVLSTGGHNESEIQMAVWTHFNGETDIVIMHCISAYPARGFHPDAILRVEHLFPHRRIGIGFSDHTTDIINAPLAAVRAGATVIEKHMTIIPDIDTPDRPHSLTPDEFKTMVKYLRGAPYEFGCDYTGEENAMALRHNRRLLATRDINPNDVLIYGHNYSACRSLVDDTEGLPPFLWERVEKKIAAKSIAVGEAIALHKIVQ